MKITSHEAFDVTCTDSSSVQFLCMEYKFGVKPISIQSLHKAIHKRIDAKLELFPSLSICDEYDSVQTLLKKMSEYCVTMTRVRGIGSFYTKLH